MSLQILPVTAADLPRMVEIHDAAFADDPVEAAMFPTRNEPGVFESQVQQLAEEMATGPDRRYMKVTETDADNVTTIISWGRWDMHLQERSASELKDHEPQNFEMGANKEYWQAFVSGLAEEQRRIFGGDPFCRELCPVQKSFLCFTLSCVD